MCPEIDWFITKLRNMGSYFGMDAGRGNAPVLCNAAGFGGN